MEFIAKEVAEDIAACKVTPDLKEHVHLFSHLQIGKMQILNPCPLNSGCPSSIYVDGVQLKVPHRIFLYGGGVGMGHYMEIYFNTLDKKYYYGWIDRSSSMPASPKFSSESWADMHKYVTDDLEFIIKHVTR